MSNQPPQQTENPDIDLRQKAIDQIWSEGLAPNESSGLRNELFSLNSHQVDNLIENYPALTENLEVVKSLLESHQILRLVSKDRKGFEQTKDHIVMFCRPKEGIISHYKAIIITSVDTNQIKVSDSAGVFVLAAQRALLQKLGIQKDTTFNIYHIVHGEINKSKQNTNAFLTGMYIFTKGLQYATLLRFPKIIFTFLQTERDINNLEEAQAKMVSNVQRTGVKAEDEVKEARAMRVLNRTHSQLPSILLNGEF